MRWPLKLQIMVPMSCLVVSTLLLVSVANAWLAGRRVRQQIETQLRDIAQTLTQSAFPLTGAVLSQMRGLSGVEFVVADKAGVVVASSGGEPVLPDVLVAPRSSLPYEIALTSRVRRGDATYFHAALSLRRPLAPEQQGYLHFFYPEAVYRRAWWDAVLPPFLLGLSALLVVVLFSLAIAQRVTRPLQGFQNQLEQIVAGRFKAMPVPRRRDELREVVLAVNQLAETLARYEQQVRRTERLRTLDQLGGGMAHQLRNAVTGCRMAVDLHRIHCSRADDEELVVAVQQLEQMEGYLRRFLALGKQGEKIAVRVDVGELVNRILPLVELRCRHLQLDLESVLSPEQLMVLGDPDALEQMVLNLLMNAMEAASESARRAELDNSRFGRIRISVRASESGMAHLEVADTGPGPAEHVRETLFEPLVSDKRDGVGLGLALARDIVRSHCGTLDWERRDGLTCFVVELPLADGKLAHQTTANETTAVQATADVDRADKETQHGACDGD